jgi:rhomboid family GlyGly-CTERM serine protease
LTERRARGVWRELLQRPGAAWLLFSALLAAGAVLIWFGSADTWDWQPRLANAQPWRWWSAAFVHLSLMHLLANLLAAALVAAYGWAARAPLEVALAWLVAWPLTHGALFAKPELAHYGGLSGVLHAGVAAATVFLIMRTHGAQRFIGWMMFIGQALKLLVEESWGAALHAPSELDVAVAPLAHAGGSLAGALCAWVALRLTGRSRSA